MESLGEKLKIFKNKEMKYEATEYYKTCTIYQKIFSL